MNTYQHGEMKLTFLQGTRYLVDGGTHFGPIPKVVWSRRIPVDDNNQIAQTTNPILIEYQGKNYLIDTSIEADRLDDKMRRNMGVHNEKNYFYDSLTSAGFTPEDIDVVLMTHFHNDHASGLVRLVDGELVSAFPNATIYLNALEWEDVLNPIPRTRGTYLKTNYEAVQDQIKTFDDHLEVAPGIELFHAGGHSRGLCVVKLTQDEDVLLHISDLALTYQQMNPLHVSAFDDYPMQSVEASEYWVNQAFENGWTFFYFHDAYYNLIRWSKDGRSIEWAQKREMEPLIPLDD